MTLASPGDDVRRRLASLFEGMMRSLFREKGAEFRVELVADPAVQAFVDAHASALDSSFAKTEMSDAMRRRLTRSNYVFSGIKAFHELNEAFPSLIDENGDRKPFERFLDDVRKIDETFNARYLRAEYGFVAASAEMAARWEQFMEDGDRYYLQYRTQRDPKVRPEHAALDRVTLPIDDSFWEEFCPPNGWNCRCTVAQVRKTKFEATDHDEAMRLGNEALRRDAKGMFRFNPGKEGKSVPDYNPYTIRKCKNCDVAKGKGTLARLTPPDSQLCQACRLLHKCADSSGCYCDEIYGERLRISNAADKSELKENLRAAKALLNSFPDMEIKILEHVLIEGRPNPEYLINGLVADRKGVMSEKGVTAGFSKAITHQGCSCVVFDFDLNMAKKNINFVEVAKRIDWRRKEFDDGVIRECYVLWQGRAVRIGAEHQTRQSILSILQKLKP